MKDYKQNLYFSIIEIYKSFRKKLEESIKKNVISLNNFECYLINDTWDKELKNNIDKIESIINKYPKKMNIIDKNNIYPQKKLVFANDISTAIDLLNNKNYLRLIKKEIMIKLFDINFLSKRNTVNYFCGNNLLIIEFKKANRYGYDISSLLITNPFDIDKDNNSSIFISIKIKEEDKLEIYKQLLSREIFLNLQKYKIDNGNNFINFDIILNLKNIDSFYNGIKSLNPNEIIKKDIMKILFYIYYFEEYLSTNDLSKIINIYHNLKYNLNYNLILLYLLYLFKFNKIISFLFSKGSMQNYHIYNND